MRIVREERLGSRVAIGEVAAPATGDQDLLADLLGVIEQQHAPAALAGAHRAHQAGGAGPDNDDIEGLAGHANAVLTIQRPTARPSSEPTTEPPT